MKELEEDYYQILGVEEKAQPDDLRKAYLKLAKKLHPDKFPNDPERKAAAQNEFAQVTRAHEVLGDPRQREEYDAIRMLQRNRAALDSGVPGSSMPAGSNIDGASSGSIPATAAEQRESKESWAAKHSVRAEDCYKRKRFQEAETAIKEAIRLDANKVKYHCQLAEIYVARGWKTLAQTELQTALRLDPKDEAAKALEQKLKVASQKAGAASAKKGGGFMDSLNKLLGKK